MDIILTRPSPPYFGLFENYPEVSGEHVSALLPNLPRDFERHRGVMPTSVSTDSIVQPLVIPDTGISSGDCLWQCLTGSPVPALTATGVAGVAEGAIPKAWVGLPRGMSGASRFTSVGSILAHHYPNIFGHQTPAILGRRAPVFGRGGIRMLPTENLWRWIGRWIPGIGWGLLAADLIVIDQCVANCTGRRSMLRALCEELTPFCARPAW